MNREAEVGLTPTEATGTADTVIAEVPVWPSLVADIVADPGATAVTRPLGLTVATAVLSLDHVTARPARETVLGQWRRSQLLSAAHE